MSLPLASPSWPAGSVEVQRPVVRTLRQPAGRPTRGGAEALPTSGTYASAPGVGHLGTGPLSPSAPSDDDGLGQLLDCSLVRDPESKLLN